MSVRRTRISCGFVAGLLAWALTLCVGLGTAWADSGGSAGGGSFDSGGSKSGSSGYGGSGGSSSGSGGYGSSGGSSSHDYGTPTTSSRTGTRSSGARSRSSGGSSVGAFVFGLGFVGFVVFMVYGFVMDRRRFAQNMDDMGGGWDLSGDVDVTALSVAVTDPDRRLQHAVEAAARTADLASSAGLASFLREVSIELRRRRNTLAYAAIRHEEDRMMQAAEKAFRGWASDARVRFEREVIRRDQGEIQETERNVETDGLTDEDGAIAVHEYCVVQLVVASRNALTTPTRLDNVQQVLALLEAYSAMGSEGLVALEVIWSPAAESDTLAKDELMTKYPELCVL